MGGYHEAKIWIICWNSVTHTNTKTFFFLNTLGFDAEGKRCTWTCIHLCLRSQSMCLCAFHVIVLKLICPPHSDWTLCVEMGLLKLCHWVNLACKNLVFSCWNGLKEWEYISSAWTGVYNLTNIQTCAWPCVCVCVCVCVYWPLLCILEDR